MELLEARIIKKVIEEIETKFPEMKDVKPQAERVVLEQEPKIYEKLGVAFPKTYIREEIIRLSFSTVIKTEDGFKMSRIVRVLVNKKGKIFKISTSK